jgi:Tfp pilus assembly protein PilO
MSEPIGAARRTTAKIIRSRYQGLMSSRRGGMFGPAEIAALAVSCLILLVVFFSYLYFLVPARSRLEALQRDREQLHANLQKYDVIVREGRDAKKTTDAITHSLATFENTGLVRQDKGRMGLYADLNEMIVKNGLRNTSGPTYSPLEPAGAKTTPGKSVTTKWQSAYPGIAVDVTVEGQYQNVRHFIQDIERSKQFIIINQVELQRATENSAPQVSGEGAGSGSRGSLVSLQVNMATYFQRPNGDAPIAGQE